MKKVMVLLFIAMLVLPLAVVFADDAQNAPDQNATNQNAQNQNAPDQNAPALSNIPMPAMPKNLPKPPSEMPVPPPMMGIGMQKTVVATSDGGVVIVEGNRVTKLDKNLEVTKSVELSDTDNTGGDKNTK